jgi:hypothetical protein
MDQAIPQPLLDQFLAVVNEGDEEKARKFLLEHLKEFPEDSRNAIITAFVEDAVAKQAEDDSLIAGLKSEGLETAHAMSAFKEEAEKRAKLDKIKKDL